MNDLLSLVAMLAIMGAIVGVSVWLAHSMGKSSEAVSELAESRSVAHTPKSADYEPTTWAEVRSRYSHAASAREYLGRNEPASQIPFGDPVFMPSGSWLTANIPVTTDELEKAKQAIKDDARHDTCLDMVPACVNPNACDNPSGPCACGAWHSEPKDTDEQKAIAEVEHFEPSRPDWDSYGSDAWTGTSDAGGGGDYGGNDY